MKNTIIWSKFSISVSILLLLLAACTPASAPPATPTPAAPLPTSVPTSNIPFVRQAQDMPLTPQDDAWAKVVEAAKKEGKLTSYSFNFTGDIGVNISRAFKDRYGIQVDIITGRGAEFIQRLQTEKRTGQILADVSDNNGVNAGIMKQEGLTVGIAGELPALRDNNVWVADIYGIDPQDKHIITFNFNNYSPYVNTNIIKPGEEPKVWKDLLDPKWKGKMMAVNPTTSAGLLNLFLPLLREKVIDEEFLKALYKQDLRFSSATPEEAGMLARGERPLSLSGISVVYSQFITQGAPIRAAELSDGTSMAPVVVVAFKEAPHPNAARVFINWLMSPEGQTIWGKGASVASVRKDVTNFLAPAAQFIPKRPMILTKEDNLEATKLFQQQWLNKLWGR
ncbi:MAG: extracellular solute-binding protein [Dehalococcoidia bacterium]|nr:extracellular solute-binding protein [Dehalococcoidia bacterium]